MSDGDFGLASGAQNDGTYSRLWHAEPIRQEEVSFESSVFLLTKVKGEERKRMSEDPHSHNRNPLQAQDRNPSLSPEFDPEPTPGDQKATLRLVGTVPPEVWNRLGTKVLPKLRSGDDLCVGIEFSVSVGSQCAQTWWSSCSRFWTILG